MSAVDHLLQVSRGDQLALLGSAALLLPVPLSVPWCCVPQAACLLSNSCKRQL